MGKGRTTTGMIVAALMADVLGGQERTYPELRADKCVHRRLLLRTYYPKEATIKTYDKLVSKEY